MAAKSNFVGGKCGVYVFAIYTKRHAEMVEKLRALKNSHFFEREFYI